jgi:hypothetical protein
MYAEVASNECKPKTSQGRTLKKARKNAIEIKITTYKITTSGSVVK